MKKQILVWTVLIACLSIHAQTYNFEQGISAYKSKDYEKALEYLSHDLIDNPKHSDGYCYRAIIYNIQHKNAEALSDINNAIKYDTKQTKISIAYCYYVRSLIYNEIEEHWKAIADLSVSIKNAATDPDYYIERAFQYEGVKEYAKAETDYRTVMKINEGDLRAWSGIGRIYYLQQRYDEAAKILTQLTKLSPDNPVGFYYKAKVEFEQHKFNEAIEDFFQVLTLDENNGKNIELFLTYAAKNYPLSLSRLNTIITANPQKDSWYVVRASVLQQKGDYESAIDDYDKILELNDASYRPTVLSFRADCYSELGNYTQALIDYDEALSSDSTDVYDLAKRGDIKRLMGKYSDAIGDFSKAISIEPNQTWFYYRRGWIKDEFMNDTEGGLNDYNQAIAIDKNYAYTYLNRGRLYEKELKDTIKAKADYNMILKLDTLIIENGNCRQYALFHLGQTDEAISWLNKILEGYPTSGNYYDAACLYALMNKPDESIGNLRHAFEKGYREFIHLATDDDLNNVRSLPAYRELVNEWKSKTSKPDTKTVSQKSAPFQKEITTHNLKSATLPMKSVGSGNYEINCQINDLSLYFLFDTGASDISISQTEVDFMLKNGYLDKSDILGSQSFSYANGESEVGTRILLRKVNLGGFIIRNVSASVVHNKKAPLLIGQSALGKYGKIVINNEKKTITIEDIKQ